MITKAYIHEYGNGKLEPEHLAVKSYLEERGIPCELFTSKRLHRNQLSFDKQTLVIADHPTIETVFKRIGYKYYGDSYPLQLRPYLKRHIWESTVQRVLMENQSPEYAGVFIKPKEKAKLFTGFVLNSQEELYLLNSISKQTKLYCSTRVEWLSEYRVFVNKGEIVGTKIYKGASEYSLNMAEVQQAISTFEASSQRTSAYGIDFGVLEDGQTALIEWNDGFSLGSYGLDKAIYTDLILTRWEEVLLDVFDS